MKLKKLLINEYRSIKREEGLLIDDRVTILIGANDHGKSNILSAIQCLNDDKQITIEDKNWDAGDGSQVEIRWHFSMTEPISDKLLGLVLVFPSEAEPERIEEKSFPANNDGEIVFYRNLQTNKVGIFSLPTEGVPISKEPEILSLRPRIELFESPTTNLRDQVNGPELETSEFEFMQGIFRLAGLWEE
ncbi:MAG: AAA family ATPase, partial [bacterium]|nr:AAA family ATPase [bacterium]